MHPRHYKPHSKVAGGNRANGSSPKHDAAAVATLEQASSPPIPYESMFNSYVLTTPVLGGPQGPPPDVLLQMCLQVGLELFENE